MKHLARKLKEHGTSSMSDVELYQLLIGDTQAAESVMEYCKGSTRVLASMYPTEVSSIPKMTESRAMRVIAAMEIGRRKLCEESLFGKVAMRSSKDIADYLMAKLSDFQHEVFYVIFMNKSNKIIHGQVVSEGGISGTVADPRIILSIALQVKATSLILSHNHPSGSIRPSRADEELTNKIKQAALYHDICVLDHVIVSDGGYYSFADEGIL